LVIRASDWIKWGIRGNKAIDVASAAREVNVTQVGQTLRVTGSRAARDTLGLRQYVNWVRPENSLLLSQTIKTKAIGSIVSLGTLAGISLGLANDTSKYLSGTYDRHDYAAALTIDTGLAIGTALLAGVVAGAATGLVAGAAGGAVVVPVIGAVPGAVLGGIAGALAGIATAIAIGVVVEATGVKPVLTQRVADLYRTWTQSSQ
jgi:hypothetical protein